MTSLSALQLSEGDPTERHRMLVTHWPVCLRQSAVTDISEPLTAMAAAVDGHRRQP